MKLPKSFYNRVSVFGAIISLTSLSVFVLLFILSYFFNVGSSYIGIFMYMIVPAFLVFGLVLIPIGMLKRAKKIANSEESEARKWRVIDFNKPGAFAGFLIFVVGTVIILILTSIGSYQAYHITESVEFCGTLCHEVMKPEYTTYQESPHARVACTECHVGTGANWYIKSKLSGAYQVYSVLAKKYPKPIPTPIESLRPARETCEECHWPQKFYSHQLRNEKHFLADSLNTEWNISLSMKIGAYHSAFVNQEGIHWHNNENVKIEYIAGDEKREYIPWVRYINKETGDTIIYEDEWMPLDDSTKLVSEKRTMDCMDCHNRPSHNFLVPQLFIDQKMATNTIPVDLPEIKKVTMDIFYNEVFTSTDTAMIVIQDKIDDFYKTNYPDIYKNNGEKIEMAIKGVQDGFKQNIFPEMQANWDAYPDHIGHMEFNGCFRCHDDYHVSAQGDRITKDCNKCHSIMMQGTPEEYEAAKHNESLPFKHPVDIDELWKESNCTECHRYLYL